MSKSEFVLAVALLVVIGYLVLPSRLQAQIREEVRRGIQREQQQAELAEAERGYAQLFSEHPEFADGDNEADWSGV